MALKKILFPNIPGGECNGQQQSSSCVEIYAEIDLTMSDKKWLMIKEQC